MATQFLEQNGGRGKNGTSFRYVWCATKQQQQHTHTQKQNLELWLYSLRVLWLKEKSFYLNTGDFILYILHEN